MASQMKLSKGDPCVNSQLVLPSLLLYTDTNFLGVIKAD